jgi:hypothetical protein
MFVTELLEHGSRRVHEADRTAQIDVAAFPIGDELCQMLRRDPPRPAVPIAAFLYLAADELAAKTGVIALRGNANMIPRNFTIHNTPKDPQNGTYTGFVGGVGRSGLRANGVEILQFAIGGLRGELSSASLFNVAEINFWDTVSCGLDGRGDGATRVRGSTFGDVWSAAKCAATAISVAPVASLRSRSTSPSRSANS